MAEVGSDLVDTSLAPHAIYTVSKESLEWIGAEARRLEVPIQIHASETEDEVDNCMREHGLRPVELLDRLGLLGERTLLAHSVWLDDHERELIRDSGATVVTNPVANMKLAVGAAFDLRAAQEHGIPVGIGTDGAGSNNSLDLLGDAKHLALLQKHEAADASVASAEEVLAILTGARAPLLGAAALEPGARRRFRPRPDRDARARHRDARGGARLLRVGVGGRHDGGRGPRADARRGRRRSRGGPRASAGASGQDRAPLMSKDKNAKEVRAGGGLVVRGKGRDAEIAVVHRPRYDDWSLPKGKLDSGESFEDGALREVEEETGFRCELGDELSQVRYRDKKGRRKVVRYWRMVPVGGEFKPNDEVDEVRWLSPKKARKLLDYDHDRRLVDELAGE